MVSSGGTLPSGLEFKVKGETELSGTYASSLFKILDYTYYSSYYSKIEPTINNTNYIGTNGKAFYGMCSYWFYNPSDERQKENISNISGALNIVTKLQGVRYDLKKEYAYDESLFKDPGILGELEAERKDKIGFLAQDVYEVLPEVVHYDDSADIYAIDYSKVVPVLVEAIKEQQLIIENLQIELTAMKNQVEESSTFKSASPFPEKQEDDMANNMLYQNQPNPFNKNTTIEYFLNDETEIAAINIYNLNGTRLKSIHINHSGYGNIIISASEFNPGMFLYTLIANGKVVDTKQMVLTE